MPKSPSTATSPTRDITGPLRGVRKPDSGIVTGGPSASTNRKPSKIVRLRVGSVLSSKATASAQPPAMSSSSPVPSWTSATMYSPGPAASTRSETSTNPWYSRAPPPDSSPASSIWVAVRCT